MGHDQLRDHVDAQIVVYFRQEGYHFNRNVNRCFVAVWENLCDYCLTNLCHDRNSLFSWIASCKVDLLEVFLQSFNCLVREQKLGRSKKALAKLLKENLILRHILKCLLVVTEFFEEPEGTELHDDWGFHV